MQSASRDAPFLNLDTQGRLVVHLASQTPDPWGMSSEYLFCRKLSKPQRQSRYCGIEKHFLPLPVTKPKSTAIQPTKVLFQIQC